MTMYLVVPQLKNRQIEFEHGCFSGQTHLRSKLRVKIFIRITSLYNYRIISKTYFEIKLKIAA